MNLKFIEYVDSRVERNRCVFLVLAFFIIGFISYGVLFNGPLLNNDSIRRIAGMTNDDRLISGRFLIGPIYDYIYQNQIFPIILFFHLILLNSLSSLVVFRIFKINSFFYQLVIASFVFSFPVMSFYIPYGQDVTAYSLSMLLSLLAGYILTRYKLDRWVLLAVVLLVLSLGIYQAFVSIALSIYVLDAYLNKYNGSNFKYLISWGVKVVFIVAFSFICYFLFLKLCLLVTGTSMGGYRNASSISFSYIIKNFPDLFFNSYVRFYDFLMGYSKIFNGRFDFKVVNFLFAVSIVYYAFVRFGFIKGVVSVFIFTLVFIPSIYTVDIITASSLYYTQVGLLSFFIAFPIVVYKTGFKYSNIIALVLVACVHVSFMKVNNYLNIFSKLTATSYKIAFKISNDLLEDDSYTKESKVLFLGAFSNNPSILLPDVKTFDDIQSTYLWGTFPGFGVNSKVNKSRKDIGYLIEDLGFNINYASYSDIKGLSGVDKLKIIESPSYPKKGYIVHASSGLTVVNLGGITPKYFN